MITNFAFWKSDGSATQWKKFEISILANSAAVTNGAVEGRFTYTSVINGPGDDDLVFGPVTLGNTYLATQCLPIDATSFVQISVIGTLTVSGSFPTITATLC